MKTEKSDIFNAEDEAAKSLQNVQMTPVGTRIMCTKDKQQGAHTESLVALGKQFCCKRTPAPNSPDSTYFPNAPNGTTPTQVEYQKLRCVHFPPKESYRV